jgi:hypothetical protein
MMMLSLIFLVSCHSIPFKPVFQYKHFSGHCALRCFDYNTLKITADENCGEDFKTNLRLPPSACDGIIGPNIIDYAEDIKPKVLEQIQECKDSMSSI